MIKSRLFNIMVPMPASDGKAAPHATIGIINASQSTVTFAGAPGVITIVWKVLGLLYPALSKSYLLPVGLSLVVGMLIYWQSAPSGATAKDRILGFTFALLNSFAIAATVLGISTAVSAASGTPAS
ncbi:MAG: hypothetical protein ACLP05_09905 [Candidatus Kryptoniota bacterium]